jgi:hypothetical protein
MSIHTIAAERVNVYTLDILSNRCPKCNTEKSKEFYTIRYIPMEHPIFINDLILDKGTHENELLNIKCGICGYERLSHCSDLVVEKTSAMDYKLPQDQMDKLSRGEAV